MPPRRHSVRQSQAIVLHDESVAWQPCPFILLEVAHGQHTRTRSRINWGTVAAIAAVCGVVVVAVLAGVGVFSRSSGRGDTNPGNASSTHVGGGSTNTVTTLSPPPTRTTMIPSAGTCSGTWSFANGKVNASVVTQGRPAMVAFGAVDNQGDQVSSSEKVAAGASTAGATLDIPQMPHLVTATVTELSASGSPTGLSAKCNLTRN